MYERGKYVVNLTQSLHQPNAADRLIFRFDIFLLQVRTKYYRQKADSQFLYLDEGISDTAESSLTHLLPMHPFSTP